MKKSNLNALRILLDRFTSPKVVVVLFVLLIGVLVPLSLFPGAAPYFLVAVKIILALLGINLGACTLRKWKVLRRSTLLIHCGALLLLGGGLLSSFGLVATVNIYEGTSTQTVYDWQAKKDIPLGFSLRVARINLSWYPVPVKIGVLRNGRKQDLIVTRTGDSFVFAGYRLHVLDLDPIARDLQLAVDDPGGAKIGTLSTSGRRSLPPDFPLDFKLVAYQQPRVKRMWVDLELRLNDTLLAEGTAEINGPLRWNGMQFFLTSVDADEFGSRYAGIQLSKDPGLPVVYGGFLVLAAGILLALGRWLGLRLQRPAPVGKEMSRDRG